MPTIKRLVLKNFKRFQSLELDFDNELNILVGGNEAGKSSMLQALDLVMSASRSKVEYFGLGNVLYGRPRITRTRCVKIQEAGLQSYIRPVVQADMPAGPDGFR